MRQIFRRSLAAASALLGGIAISTVLGSVPAQADTEDCIRVLEILRYPITSQIVGACPVSEANGPINGEALCTSRLITLRVQRVDAIRACRAGARL